MGAERGNAARWARVRELVERALDLELEEREEFLRAEAGGDAQLLAEALELVALHRQDDGSFEPGTGTPLAALIAPPTPSGAPERRVGPYALRRELGAGGMGQVFLAARADGQFQQQVAVKLLQVGADDEELSERFRRERQVLANLQHPGIARLVDGGVTDEGSSYLVMEYVEGVPIDRFCDENRLTTRERVALFRRVCEAVHYAHRSLVVHRDLKPSNVFVTPGGEPKLLDFGIAKVLDPEKSAAVEVTGPLMRFMTPAYASPEQLRGRPITTSSDVYSLGVLLYRLLTGHLPYALERRSPLEMERIVCEEEPERPSTVITKVVELPTSQRTPTTSHVSPELVCSQRLTTPRLLRRMLAGDLDRIVLKALRKEPHRRYTSVEQLSEDLGRYLDGLPVVARPDTRGYRLRKFVGRHRLPMAVAAVALVALVGGLVSSLVLYRRADAAAQDEKAQRELAQERLEEVERLAHDLGEERRLAEDRLEEVVALNAELGSEQALAEGRLDSLVDLALTIVFDLHRKIHALQGATEATELALRTGLSKLEELGVEERDDIDLLRRLSGGYARLGQVQGDPEAPNLGRTEEALASYGHSLELAERALALGPDDSGSVFALLVASRSLGRLLANRGERDEALPVFLRALDACEALPVERRREVPGLCFAEYELIQIVADHMREAGELEVAAGLLERAEVVLEEFLSLPGQDPKFVAARAQLAGLKARLHNDRGDLDAALEEAERALMILEPLVESRPEDGILERDLTVAREFYAALLSAKGEPELALVLLEANEEVLRERFEEDPRDHQARRDLVSVYYHLGEAHQLRGDWEGARAAHERAVELAEGMVEATGGAPESVIFHATSLIKLGGAESRLGLLLEAADHMQQARRLFEELCARRPENADNWRALYGTLGELGALYRKMAEREPDQRLRRTCLERARGWFEEGLAAVDELDRRALSKERDEHWRARLSEDAAACAAELGAADGGVEGDG